jgi:amidase
MATVFHHVTRCLRLIKTTGTNFDRSVYLDTPLCVQVVASKLQEETLVAAMTAIDNALKVQDGMLAKL